MFELLNQQLRAGRKEITGEFFQKLIAFDGAVGDQFGISVAVSADGSAIVTGARHDDDKGTDSGSVYVFTRLPNGSYIQTQKLVAPDGAAGDYFGISVSVSSDASVLVVGAYGDDDKGADSGSAYIFTKQANGNYVQLQKLTAPDGAIGDYFGRSTSVSADGSVIVVGAYTDDDKGSNSGSVYIFTKQANGTYAQKQKLTASDGAANDYFGASMSVSSDASVLVVNAYGDDDKGVDSGSVYVFTRQASGTYLQTQKLTASDGTISDYFGYSVSISADGSVIVVGSHKDDDKGTDSGSARIFAKQANGSYNQFQKLTASDGADSDFFGYSVSVSAEGSTVVIGAYNDDDIVTNSGSAYIFTRQVDGTYTQKQKLIPLTAVPNALFGHCVNVADGAVIVGAYSEAIDGKSATGAAYVFK